ncbi:hypothetical protein [Xanthomonas citri]|uniref:hypothetical protein n=1 Tax=Xanthomonas citri TaxID=346 RepID=UPI001F39F30C|nr:hypothetical protein [Xanthomonas citri]
MEFDDWLIADGPGSRNQQENDKWTLPGNYTDARGTTFGSGWEENVKHAIAVIKKDPSHMRTLMTDAEIRILQREKAAAEAAGLEPQNTFGGWTPANRHRKIVPQALQKARAKVLRTPLPDRVNLIGWSRGAVTCHMMANAMYADPEVSPHFFLRDQALGGPGGGRRCAHGARFKVIKPEKSADHARQRSIAEVPV